MPIALKPLTREQADLRALMLSLHGSWQAARGELARDYDYALGWREAEGGEVRLARRNADGSEADLGPRNSGSEEIFSRWQDGKAALRARVTSMERELQNKAAAVRDAGLGRVPPVAADILRRLERQGLLGRSALLAATSAMLTYEAAAEVSLAVRAGARAEDGLLPEVPNRLFLAFVGLPTDALLALLKQSDDSFTLAKGGRDLATNAAGFAVEWLALANRVARPEGSDRDIAWLMASEPFEAVGFGEDGMPVPLVAPDPRAFTLHKLWLSQRPDRDEPKKRRDLMQAVVCGTMARDRLRLPFAAEHLKDIPVGLFDPRP